MDLHCSEKSGSCNSARLAATDEDIESTLGSKENGYLIKATRKTTFLVVAGSQMGYSTVSPFIKSSSGERVSKAEQIVLYIP